MNPIFPRRLIGAIHSTIPVCPNCDRAMTRQDWNTGRPRATCHPCGRVYYFKSDGEIALSAKLRRAA